MDERLISLLNIGWAGLRGFPQIYMKRDQWPVADDKLLHRWRETETLSEAGTFVAEHDDGNLAAVFSVSPGNHAQGRLNFFCVNAHYTTESYGPRLLRASEAYLRRCGMQSVITCEIDSRCQMRNRFLRAMRYRLLAPDNQTTTMMLRPDEHQFHEINLASSFCTIATWHDDYLTPWVRIASEAFGTLHDEEMFIRVAPPRNQFDPQGWLLAICDGQAVGTTAARTCYNEDGSIRGGNIEWVAVRPQCQHQGIGRALVSAALNYFFEREITPVCLNVHSGNSIAVHLYETLGFELAAINHVYRKDL